jgi:hypothetical protein
MISKRRRRNRTLFRLLTGRQQTTASFQWLAPPTLSSCGWRSRRHKQAESLARLSLEMSRAKGLIEIPPTRAKPVQFKMVAFPRSAFGTARAPASIQLESIDRDLNQSIKIRVVIARQFKGHFRRPSFAIERTRSNRSIRTHLEIGKSNHDDDHS